MIDETVDQAGQGPERVGFCQDCGKPLTRETVQTVGSRVFCEPCLTSRMAAGTAYGATPPPPPQPGTGTASGGGNVAGGVPPVYTEPFPPMGGNNPSPGLAALLGFIPGVGAMYNGQFAKGIAHFVIFVLLKSMGHGYGLFDGLAACWVFYQVFDAYHTAKARREGLPLPDPFGLNNVGQYVGVHFRGNAAGGPPNPGQPTSYPGWTGYVPPPPVVTTPPEPSVPPSQWAGVPVPPVSPYTAPYAPYAPYTPPPPAAGSPGWVDTAGSVPMAPVRVNRFPGAAVWLIGFGVLFTCINFFPELRFSVTKIFPIFLIVLAVGIFVRRMMVTGGLVPTDTEGFGYGPRIACSLRGPVILLTLGVLMSLQSFEVIRFGRTWPVLVIVIGLLLLLERAVGSRVVPVADVNATNGDGKGL